MVLALDVTLQLRAIEVHISQIASAVPRGLIVEVRRRRIAALAAGRARPGRTRSPNSTTATKLFPLVPYIFLVPLYVRAPKDASEPHREEVKPTGMLGPASLNGWTISPVRRWNRLMSPQGVFQLPKSLASLSDAADSACSSRSAGV